MTDWIANSESGASVRAKLNSIPNDGSVSTAVQPSDYSKYVNLSGAGLTGDYNIVDNTTIQRVNISGNGFTTFSATGASSLDEVILTGVSTLTSFVALGSDPNLLAAIDVSANTGLLTLMIKSHQLSAIDVSANTALTTLYMDETPLTALNVSANVSLTELDIVANLLTSIDVSTNTSLTALRLTDTPVTTLDISANTALQILAVDGTSLTALSLGPHTALSYLNAGNTALTTLDISTNTLLTHINMNNAHLTQGAVDGILANLDSAGQSGGFADLSGPLNASPSAAGLVSRTSLIGKGWEVDVQ